MAITITDSVKEPRSWSVGPRKVQLVEFVANSGETSGTVTADNLMRMDHILLLNGRIRHSSAPTYATNIATLAFTVTAETAATLEVQDITYTAVANLGAGGNDITIEYTDTETAGAEVVTVTGTAIVVGIESGVSTATQVEAAYSASAEATALATAAITGTAGDAQVTAAETALAGGVTGGARGTALCIGV